MFFEVYCLCVLVVYFSCVFGGLFCICFGGFSGRVFLFLARLFFYRASSFRAFRSRKLSLGRASKSEAGDFLGGLHRNPGDFSVLPEQIYPSAKPFRVSDRRRSPVRCRDGGRCCTGNGVFEAFLRPIWRILVNAIWWFIVYVVGLTSCFL